MRIFVGLDNGLLPDRFGKHAPEAYQLDGHPVRSFPIEIADVPEGARTLALTFLDYDAVPVGGFCWIHWLACDIAPDTTLVPRTPAPRASWLAYRLEQRLVASGRQPYRPADHPSLRGPYPPDKTHDYTLTVYALDCELGLSEGYFLNEFRRAVRGHVLDEASLELPAAHREARGSRSHRASARTYICSRFARARAGNHAFSEIARDRILLRASANRFWKVMGALFDEPEPLGIEGRAAFLDAHGIALWDVLSSCTIVGASDASIVDPVANDLSRIAEAAPLEAVFTTGSKATALYRRFGAPQLPGLAHTGLPSTSPANARMRLDDLVKAYLPIRETLERRDGGGR